MPISVKWKKESLKQNPCNTCERRGLCRDTSYESPSRLSGRSAFQLETKTDIAGFHIHLLKFDTIVSDGGSNGWNNIAGARQYETLIERFYADEELRTVFFHDHLFANSHQQHGVFGALIIEPEGSTFHDIRTGEKIKVVPGSHSQSEWKGLS
jgi:hypothetical protein